MPEYDGYSPSRLKRKTRFMVDVFKFQDAREYLHAVFAEKKKANNEYSLSLWAKELGYDNPSTLSSVLRNVRPIGQKLRASIKQRYNLDLKQQLYFDLIANYCDTADEQQKSFFFEMIQTTNKNVALHFVDNDRFKTIADWWHIAIVELLKLSNTDGTVKELSSALRPFVSKEQVEKALFRLKRLGVVAQVGRNFHLKTDHLVIGDKGRSEAVQAFHEGLLKISQEKLKADSVEDRDFRATFLPIKLKDLEKAKKLAAEFHQKMYELASNDDGEVVLELHSQVVIWGSK